MRSNDDLDLHGKFGTGMIVRWDDELWIVGEVRDTKLALFPLDRNRVSVHPSMTFPWLPQDNDVDPGVRRPDPTKTVDTVEVVAASVEDLIMKRLRGILFNKPLWKKE